MKYKYISLLLALALLSCTKEEQQTLPEVQQTETTTTEEAMYIPGVITIKLSDEMLNLVEEDIAQGKIATKSMSLNQAIDELGIISIRRTFPDAGEYEGRTRREGLHKWYTIEYDQNQPTTKANDEFSAIEGIENVCPRRRLATNNYFNDKYYSVQWGIENTSYPEADANVVNVWRHYTTGSPEVIVAVVDQGIDITHVDLADNCLTAEDGNYNFCDMSTELTPGYHGIHVAGIISAISNNEIGVAGVAGGDYANGQGGVKLLSCQIFKDNSNGDAPAAIKWAADHGAVICNNSWGYYYDTDDDGIISEKEHQKALNDKLSQVEMDAIDYFVKYAGCDDEGNQKEDSPMKGGLILFASGNEGLEVGLPASYEPAVAVGAIDQDGKIADYANHGDWVDIAAPGTQIASTYIDNNWAYITGTSMACPFVSGAAALLVSYYGGQGFTCDDLKEKLIKGANYDHFEDNTIVGPLLDIMGAFAYGSTTTPSSVNDYTAEGRSNNIDLGWNITSDEDGIPAYGTLAIYSTDKEAVEGQDPSNPSEKASTIKFKTGNLNTGELQSEEITDLEFETTYYIALAPYSYNGNYAALSKVKSVTTEANNPPIISTNDAVEGISLTYSQSVTINFVITEPDGHDFKVEYAAGSNAESINIDEVENSKTSATLTISGAVEEIGTYSGVLTATDSYGKSSSITITYKLVNEAPVANPNIVDILIYGTGVTKNIYLDDYFSDPDGDPIEYSISNSDGNIVSTSLTKATLTMTTKSYGMTTINITASDPHKASATQTFNVLVRKEGAEMVAYPNPVSTTLYIATGEDETDTEVSVVSLTGSTIFKSTEKASAFNPMKIDMSSAAPGRYVVIAKWDGTEHKQEIVKK